MKFSIVIYKTPIHIAIEKGNIEIVKILLNTNKVELNYAYLYISKIQFECHSKINFSMIFNFFFF